MTFGGEIFSTKDIKESKKPLALTNAENQINMKSVTNESE
jgi:hypothetical protein